MIFYVFSNHKGVIITERMNLMGLIVCVEYTINTWGTFRMKCHMCIRNSRILHNKIKVIYYLKHRFFTDFF